MKKLIMLSLYISQLLPGKTQKIGILKYPDYYGRDLGLIYTPQESKFRIWAPTATRAQLMIYLKGEGGMKSDLINMDKSKNGTWTAKVQKDVKGRYYAFRVMINGQWKNEVPDPYAKAVGINGKRGMIIDLNETNPAGWERDASPVFKHPTDAVIYELQIRDASIAANSGITNKGKYIGLTEKGTVNESGLSTGLDHLKELGVTHIHLLPFFDFRSIDETLLNKPQYNWGYDPLNYNAPEGSFSTNPYDGAVRIKELKQLIKAFHENGLRVVMDVVYNHTGLTQDSYFNQLVPDYYYRTTPDGKYSDATACGNETASERYMMRKFMIESMKYWVSEYHIDGFRIDLMGVHDIVTMNLLSKELHRLRPDILLYGEGWSAATSVLPESERAVKKFAYQLDSIAVFSDDIRDGIKGSVFDEKDKGFVSGKPGMEESIKFGVVASCPHPQVDYSKVNYSKAAYAAQPYHTITYCECHDNHVLWDKLALSAKYATEDERKEMHKLSLSIVLTSQGISFLHAGTEFLRTKKGDENSFDAGDSINAIDWSLKTKNKDVFDYVKALIKMRKEHPAFRMTTAADIKKNLLFLENLPENVVAYTLNGAAVKDSWEKITVYYNGNDEEIKLPLESADWKEAISNNKTSVNTELINSVILKPYSCTVVYK